MTATTGADTMNMMIMKSLLYLLNPPVYASEAKDPFRNNSLLNLLNLPNLLNILNHPQNQDMLHHLPLETLQSLDRNPPTRLVMTDEILEPLNQQF